MAGKRRETLLLKYGTLAFFIIVTLMVTFLFAITKIISKPIEDIYTNSITTILDQAVSSAETWFENQVEVLQVFQRSVVRKTTDRETIKETIKITDKPDNFEYVMVFWDDAIGAKDGGPETYNTKGGISVVGILAKEYWKMHKEKNVDVWLESPRQSNAGGINMPLFVKSNFIDSETGKEVNGGMVGFLELEPINALSKKFYKTGLISIYDDANELRAGEDVLNLEDKSKLRIFTKEVNLGNKVWTIVASIENQEVNGIKKNLQISSSFGGAIVTLVMLISILIIIRIMIGKFNSIKISIDELNTGDKDLSKRLHIRHNNEISMVKKSVNVFVNTVHETVKHIGEANQQLKATFGNVKNSITESQDQIRTISTEIADAKETLSSEDKCVIDTSSSITQISQNIRDLNSMISSQAESIQRAGSSIEEMIGNIRSVSISVEKMSGDFAQLNKATQDGIAKNKIVNELLATVLAQSQSLQDTNKIISDISSQTNLLSMNAMIESAHAGEAGKGFAVVAEEIRKLADTSATQSKSIGENLKKIAENIGKVVESANASKVSFETVSEKTQDTFSLVESIRSAMSEQNDGSKLVLDVLSQMNETSAQVQTSSKEIEDGTNGVLNSISSLKNSSADMSSNFSKIVSTTESTLMTTEILSKLTKEMTTAIDNISQKINEFKI